MLIAELELLFQGLKKHDIFVTNIEKYADPMGYLLYDSTWVDQREVLITQLDLPFSGTFAVQKLSEDLSLLSFDNKLNRQFEVSEELQEQPRIVCDITQWNKSLIMCCPRISDTCSSWL